MTPSPTIRLPDGRLQCEQCGVIIPGTIAPGRFYCACSQSARKPLAAPHFAALGDRLAVWLCRRGITPARIDAALRRVGIVTGCGCQRRRELLNRLWPWILGEIWGDGPIRRARPKSLGACRRAA